MVNSKCVRFVEIIFSIVHGAVCELTVCIHIVGGHQATDTYEVLFKWFLLPVAGLMPKCCPLYELVGKLVCTCNRATVPLARSVYRNLSANSHTLHIVPKLYRSLGSGGQCTVFPVGSEK